MILNFKCCVGKNGLNSNKKEGDYSTPKGFKNLKKLYFRKDRIKKPQLWQKRKLSQKNLKYDDPKHKKYNEEIHNFNKKKNKEIFYREDHIYLY